MSEPVGSRTTFFTLVDFCVRMHWWVRQKYELLDVFVDIVWAFIFSKVCCDMALRPLGKNLAYFWCSVGSGILPMLRYWHFTVTPPVFWA
jgi:hypothetical protein